MTTVNPDRIPKRQHYRVVPDRSALLIEVATSVGPVMFGVVGLEGFVRVAVRGAGLDLAATPNAHLELQLRDLRSGNSAYDGELQRHIDARRFRRSCRSPPRPLCRGQLIGLPGRRRHHVPWNHSSGSKDSSRFPKPGLCE